MSTDTYEKKVAQKILRAGVTLVAASLALTVVGCGDPPPPRQPKVIVAVAPPPPPVVKVEAPPPPPPEVEVYVPKPIKLPGSIKFKTGSAELDPASDNVLQVVLDYLKHDADATKLRIEGHTDNVGGTDPNQKLSEGRAMSCAHWLIKHGVDCHRLVPLGYGETNPVADNKTEDGRAQNRRVVFIDSERKGKRVGKFTGGHIAGDPCNK